jgi:hypothetical protein
MTALLLVAGANYSEAQTAAKKVRLSIPSANGNALRLFDCQR